VKGKVDYPAARNKALKIIYLNPSGSLGGAERALLNLMHAVRQTRPDWNLELIVGASGDLATVAHDLGIDTHVLPLPAAASRLGDAGSGGPAGGEVSKLDLLRGLTISSPRLGAYVLQLGSFLRGHQPDLIHSNGFKTHILAAWAAPRRCKVLWHVHDYVGSRPLMSRLMRAHAGRCDIALANSHSVARDLNSVCRGKVKIITVHNAVDLERFNPCGSVLDLDMLSGLPLAMQGTVRVGLVATMARWKGHEVFLRALSILPKALPIRGYVIGGPIYATRGSQYSVDELRNLASSLGLNGKVAFTGYVDDSASAMRALDIVVHASTQPEPFGLAVAEAMACGRPVVASNAGGVSEIISEDETALGHVPGDAAALAECIARLAADHCLRKKLGAKGRRLAEKQFDPSRLAGDVPPIYELAAQAQT
jgi:glycosyltransferase involved in cell wall biosynthesis